MFSRITLPLTVMFLTGCGVSQNQMTDIQTNMQDLNDRIVQLEAQQQVLSQQIASGGIRVPTGITAVPSQRRSGVYDDQPIDAETNTVDGLEQGLSLYRAGDITNAIGVLVEYINNSNLTGSSAARVNLARYWLGDAYYTQRQYEAASRYFGQYLREEPQGEKSAPALEKLSQSLRALGRNHDADLLSQYGVQAIVGNTTQ